MLLFIKHLMDASDIVIITLLTIVTVISLIGFYMYVTSIQEQKYIIEQQLKTLRHSTTNTVQYSNSPPPEEREIRVFPINVPTQKIDTYRQVGTLSSNDETPKVLPLYGRRTVNGSSKWNYYTSTDSYHSFDISVIFKNKDCSDEYGCEEITSGDVIQIPAYHSVFTVSMYKLSGPTYIPYV